MVGLNGDFAFASRNFNWEFSVSYGASDNTQSTPSYVFQNVANALNATTNAAGQIVCAGTPVNGPTTTASSQCAPLNIFRQWLAVLSRAAVHHSPGAGRLFQHAKRYQCLHRRRYSEGAGRRVEIFRWI